MHRNLLALGLALTALAFTGLAATDIRLGTWKLNVAKSKTSGPAIKSQTDVREALPDGRVQLSRTIEYMSGTTEKLVFAFKYDGRDYPVKGAPFDTIAVKRIDNQTIKFRATKEKSKYDISGTTVVSTDLRTMTQTSKGTDADGKPVEATLVFERK